MKLSFTTMATPELDHVNAIALAMKFGFQGIDLRCDRRCGELSLDSTDDDLDRIAFDFREARLKIPSLLCYNTIDADGPKPHHALPAEARRMLEIAKRLGAGAIRIFGGRLDESRLKVLAMIIRNVLDEQGEGPSIYLQNHGPALSSKHALDLALCVDHPNFGLVYSPDHDFMMGESDVDNLLPQILPWTREIYLSDVADLKGSAVFPGQGLVPLERVRQFFRDREFDGFYSLKWERIWQPHLPQPEVALPAYVEFMQAIS